MNEEKDFEPDTQANSKDDVDDHLLRMRFGWDDLIEEMIQDGQKSGAFENLSGKGKPLNLDRNQYGAEWDLAHSLMKENDVLPPWIDKRNRIVAEIELMRNEIARQWARFNRAYGLAQGQSHRDALVLQWDEACRGWEEKIRDVNKKIDDFNLGRPSDNLEIYRLRLEDELRRVGAKRGLKEGS